MTHWLMQRFHQYGNIPALVDKKGLHSYQILLQQIEYFIPKLQKQIPTGSTVMILSDYSLHSIALLLACLDLNLIIVPVIACNEQEIKEKLSVSGAKFILTLKDVDVQIKNTDENKLTDNHLCQTLINRGHSGLILFSSGSTGKPKAMLHDLTNMLDTYQHKKRKKLSILVFLLFDHIGGINTLFNILSMGAKAVIPENRVAESIAKVIEQEKVSILPASPTFLNLLLLADVSNKYDLSTVRMITYGTENMPESLLKRIKLAFPKARLLQTFGTSETGIAQVNSRSSSSLDIKIDDPNLDYKIIDGELWLKSKIQILGYLNASMENFTEDGWFCTGDLVEESTDGYLKIIGRTKEVINVGGEKVLPTEVESLLLTIEGVKDCMVYGVQNAIIGQTVVADVVIDSLKSNTKDTKELKNLIRKTCMKNMQRYKMPTKFNFIKQLQIGNRFKKIRNKH